MQRIHLDRLHARAAAVALTLGALLTLWAGPARAAVEYAQCRGSIVVAAVGTQLALQVVHGDLQDVAFRARATLTQGGEDVDAVFPCAVEGDALVCSGLGSMPLAPAVEGAVNSFLLEVSGLTAELTMLEFRSAGEVTESGVKWNWWTRQCELELDDLAECDAACEARGYPGSEALAWQTGTGCSLGCRCYTENGDVGGVFPEPDDFME
ncbi:MAG: hypothetical protein QNK03_05150 [Myxococcota bacterium]|nr:hypothetical protein [Myxococcota bacterium]